jgi:hypothetical protein
MSKNCDTKPVRQTGGVVWSVENPKDWMIRDKVTTGFDNKDISTLFRSSLSTSGTSTAI